VDDPALDFWRAVPNRQMSKLECPGVRPIFHALEKLNLDDRNLQQFKETNHP
jgi:hypothetical protein